MNWFIEEADALDANSVLFMGSATFSAREFDRDC